jgi:hypothetical protein
MRSRAWGESGESVKFVGIYLMMAATGMVLWTWVVIDARVHSLHLAALLAAECLAFFAGRPLEKWLRNRKGKA